MTFREYCDAFFANEKSSLQDVTDEEIKLLKSLKETETINIDYLYLDAKISDYIAEKDFNSFSNDSASAKGWMYEYVVGIILKLEEIREEDFFNQSDEKIFDTVDSFFKKFPFMFATLKFIERKMWLYVSIYNSSIQSSKQYTDNNFESLSLSLDNSIKTVNDTNKNLLESKNDLITAKKTLTKAQNKITDVEHQLKFSIDTIENIMPNMLTVLSILISIIIAVVIVYITIFLDDGNNGFKSILQVQMGRYVLSGHIVGNIMFLSMFMIARLTNRSILLTCSHYQLKDEFENSDEDKYVSDIHKHSCANCKNKCSTKEKLNNRGAYIVWFNIVMVLLYFVLYVWWVIEHYWPLGWKEFYKSQDIYVTGIISVSLFGFILFEVAKLCNNKITKTKKQKYLKRLLANLRINNENMYLLEVFSNEELKYTKSVDLKDKNPSVKIDKKLNEFAKSNSKANCLKYCWIDNGKDHILCYGLFE